MASFFPTVREIFLLGGHLVFLLTFPTTYKTPSVSLSDIARFRYNDYYGEETEDIAPVTFEDRFSLQELSAPLTWGMGQVPKTEIVLHVPGM